VPLEGAAILVVDDEATVRRALRRVLELEDATVIEAADVDEAMHIVGHDDGRSIEAAVVDLVMPGVSGSELIGVLHDCRPDLPLLAMTARLDVPELPPVPMLLKPFADEHLLAALAPLVRRSRRLRGGPGKAHATAIALCARAARECPAASELVASLAHRRATRTTAT